MYSKEQLLIALRREFDILKHLGSKAETETHLSHKFTEPQRTVRELMVYLGYSVGKQVDLIVKGERDPSAFADMEELGKNFDPKQWDMVMDTEYNHIATAIQGLDEQSLSTPIHLFGKTQTRTEFLVEYLLTLLGAYKMQLFLQLKHAGRAELSTYNVRAGMDAPKKD